MARNACAALARDRDGAASVSAARQNGCSEWNPPAAAGQDRGGRLPRNWRRRIDRISEDDRRWFERNPTRSFRLRDYVEGEHGPWPHDGARLTHTLVRQVAPGARIRIPLALRGEVWLNAEAVCRELWNKVAGGHTIGGTPIDALPERITEAVCGQASSWCPS